MHGVVVVGGLLRSASVLLLLCLAATVSLVVYNVRSRVMVTTEEYERQNLLRNELTRQRDEISSRLNSLQVEISCVCFSIRES